LAEHPRILDSRKSSNYKRRAHASLPGLRKIERAWAQVAQLVEHCTENAGVGGSIPPLGTTYFFAIVRHCSNMPENAWGREGDPVATMRARLLVFAKNVGIFVGIRAAKKGDTNIPLSDTTVRKAQTGHEAYEAIGWRRLAPAHSAHWQQTVEAGL
jgi:hypothetical protein